MLVNPADYTEYIIMDICNFLGPAFPLTRPITTGKIF